MKNQNKLFAVLTALFVVLMSIPFLVPHCGLFALVGFVPLLCMERIASQTGAKRFRMWHYGAFVLWNAATTFWVCNATVGGGLFAIFANAFQMSLIFGLFRWSKRHLKDSLAYIFLAVMWIAWERAYFSAQISWPWLTLGNAFAGSTSLIQWYEFTGTLGG
ncbi:MAG: apolipoprotein N-acyltransferase, partial [Bacteroidales bacterium]